jgi:hypothetical protein
MTHPVSNPESGAARAHFLVKCTLTAKLSTVVCMGTLERRKSTLVEAAEAAVDWEAVQMRKSESHVLTDRQFSGKTTMRTLFIRATSDVSQPSACR